MLLLSGPQVPLWRAVPCPVPRRRPPAPASGRAKWREAPLLVSRQPHTREPDQTVSRACPGRVAARARAPGQPQPLRSPPGRGVGANLLGTRLLREACGGSKSELLRPGHAPTSSRQGVRGARLERGNGRVHMAVRKRAWGRARASSSARAWPRAS